MAQPFADETFDIAVMPLVIFFVSDPGKGVAEMVRVVRVGGTVATYAWDMSGGGFLYHTLHTEMRNLGISISAPPSPEPSRMEVMRDLWVDARLEDIETRDITVRRSFTDFDDYWTTALGAPSVGGTLATMAPEDFATLKSRVQARLPEDAAGRITYEVRANAMKGRTPM